MSRIPLLPKWVLPSVSSIYDLESATISEMVPKLYGTMRDMVNNYNEFADELNEEIRNFTGSTSEEIANFKQSIEERLRCKFNDLDAQLSRIRLDMKQYTDTTMQRAFDVFGVTVKEAGENLQLTDATDEQIRALSIYGKTTQQWEPVPEYPAALQSVGDAGSVTVKITNGTDEQQLTITTPEKLHGVPVPDGGNYTDATGQRWICDEIDLNRGVYVQRVFRVKIENAANVTVMGETTRFSGDLPKNAPYNNELSTTGEPIGYGICTHLPFLGGYSADNPHFYTQAKTAWLFLPIEYGTTTEELNEWLNNNNLEVIYELVEPIERPLTTAELAAYKQLHTYMPDTTVTTDTGAGILLEYVAIVQQFMDRYVASLKQSVDEIRNLVEKKFLFVRYNEWEEKATHNALEISEHIYTGGIAILNAIIVDTLEEYRGYTLSFSRIDHEGAHFECADHDSKTIIDYVIGGDGTVIKNVAPLGNFVVTVDGEHVSHTPAQMKEAADRGFTVVLNPNDGFYYNLAHADIYTALFIVATDDPGVYYYTINEDRTFSYTEEYVTPQSYVDFAPVNMTFIEATKTASTTPAQIYEYMSQGSSVIAKVRSSAGEERFIRLVNATESEAYFLEMTDELFPMIKYTLRSDKSYVTEEINL